jgi:hypothetical protein
MDSQIMIDYEAVDTICKNKLKIANPSKRNHNQAISHALSAVTRQWLTNVDN